MSLRHKMKSKYVQNLIRYAGNKKEIKLKKTVIVILNCFFSETPLTKQIKLEQNY